MGLHAAFPCRTRAIHGKAVFEFFNPGARLLQLMAQRGHAVAFLISQFTRIMHLSPAGRMHGSNGENRKLVNHTHHPPAMHPHRMQRRMHNPEIPRRFAGYHALIHHADITAHLLQRVQ